MAAREFAVPADQELLDALGVLPREEEGDPAVRVLDIVTADPADSMTVSYDVPGRSIRLLWRRQGVVQVDLYRESATRLTVSVESGTTAVCVDFDSESLAGRLSVNIYPELAIHDQLLFR